MPAPNDSSNLRIALPPNTSKIPQMNTYLNQRLDTLGIKPEQLSARRQSLDYPSKDIQLLTSDRSDNIEIHYLDPDGFAYVYDSKGEIKEFVRTRLKIVNDGPKYIQPKRSGVFPFFPPGIIRKFQAASVIKTLFLVEGEFKAIAGEHHLGLDFVGIPGIHNFKEKGESKLAADILKIIEKCHVKSVVLLFDADCLSVKFDPDEDVDLYKRPNSFYSAVRNFKEITKALNVDVYFSHLLAKYESDAKGLDDLIAQEGTDRQKLINELKDFTVGIERQYIHCLSISENSISQLRKYFSIDKVENFYSAYAKQLQEHDFVFNGHHYKHDGEKLKIKKHKDADLFLRVATDYFKTVYTKTCKGDVLKALKRWKVGEISRDYVQKGHRKFFDQIRKYDAFCNIPDNTENYKRIHTIHQDDRLAYNYNMYDELEIKPEKGDCSNSLNFLLHLTNYENPELKEMEGDKYTIMLDYLTLLYKNPLQMLPVVCLVSKEQGTGKSTFLKWLKEIYKTNAVILGNNEFKLEFNAHYITKFLIMIDETYIEFEKKAVKERIKRMTTSGRELIQFKGSDLFEPKLSDSA
jgi:Family of unknown function (DUF5906)/Domain of unknown function (DUF3854)